LRIVGGKFKGRRLLAPSSIPARPTTDYAKEALFNILQNQMEWEECEMLDLFSGIGSISLEAISRGAKSVTSIDKHPKAIHWLKNVTNALSISNLIFQREDAFKWLNKNEKQFDLVFADPPYEFAQYDELIEVVLNRALKADANFILEHRQSGSFVKHSNFVEDRTYGEVRFSFFRNI
jgi:16S rRNA (guanine966-N2)-methyltransferase